MAATALEPAPRYSKHVEVDVKADAELLVAPYRAELSGTPDLLYAQRKSTSSAAECNAPMKGPHGRSKKGRHCHCHYIHARSVPPVLQARPARAVEVGNTMGGALWEDWVDVGQIGAATTAIAGL